MTYIKVNDTLYPAIINGNKEDFSWDNRETKSIILTMSYDDVVALLPNNVNWSIVYVEGEGEEETTTEYDNSDFCISGDITDHRDGTVTIKMGKLTEIEEAYALLLGGDLDE